jgi:hypothetical protein
MKGYPRGFRRLLLATLLAVALSGLLLVPTLLTMRADVELAWRLPASGRVGMAALHAGVGMLLLALCGALWSVHMRAGWRKHRQRGSGGTLTVAITTLALSALALYYAGDETWSTAAAWIHLAAGLALAGVFGWHWRCAHRARSAARTAVIRPRPQLNAD